MAHSFLSLGSLVTFVGLHRFSFRSNSYYFSKTRHHPAWASRPTVTNSALDKKAYPINNPINIGYCLRRSRDLLIQRVLSDVLSFEDGIVCTYSIDYYYSPHFVSSSVSRASARSLHRPPRPHGSRGRRRNSPNCSDLGYWLCPSRCRHRHSTAPMRNSSACTFRRPWIRKRCSIAFAYFVFWGYYSIYYSI